MIIVETHNFDLTSTGNQAVKVEMAIYSACIYIKYTSKSWMWADGKLKHAVIVSNIKYNISIYCMCCSWTKNRSNYTLHSFSLFCKVFFNFNKTELWGPDIHGMVIKGNIYSIITRQGHPSICWEMILCGKSVLREFLSLHTCKGWHSTLYIEHP